MSRDEDYHYFDHPLTPGRDDEGKNMWLEANVYYSLGGHNYWSGKNDPRGIWINFTPVGREHTSTPGVSVKQMLIGDKRGRRMFLRPLKRKSKKQADDVVARIKPVQADIMQAAIHQDWPKVDRILRSAMR